MNKKKIYYWLLLPVLALMIGACGKSDDEGVLTPDVNVGETVTDFKKTVKYEDTKQFLTDRDAITGMMLNLYGIRWSYWRMVSNDFKNHIFKKSKYGKPILHEVQKNIGKPIHLHIDYDEFKEKFKDKEFYIYE